jgi:predicted alpha/beta hydrolase family esterase
MTNVFIIHGSYGHPEENWFPWLKKELEKLSHTVYIPKFPTPEGQTLENWLKVFENYEQHLDKSSICVGHSCGAAFVLNLLERINHPIKAAFLIAGSVGLLNNEFDKVSSTFTNRRFDWKKIKKNCTKFYVFHSDNDPYVPLKKGIELAKKLGVDIILVKNAGHFNEKSGYTRFDLLLEKIKDELEELSSLEE